MQGIIIKIWCKYTSRPPHGTYDPSGKASWSMADLFLVWSCWQFIELPGPEDRTTDYANPALHTYRSLYHRYEPLTPYESLNSPYWKLQSKLKNLDRTQCATYNHLKHRINFKPPVIHRPSSENEPAAGSRLNRGGKERWMCPLDTKFKA